jgi:hypothetical protein
VWGLRLQVANRLWGMIRNVHRVFVLKAGPHPKQMLTTGPWVSCILNSEGRKEGKIYIEVYWLGSMLETWHNQASA